MHEDNSSRCREGPWRQSLRRVHAHQARTSTADPTQILILRGGPGQGPWVLYGHSYGAVCALGAALLTRNIEQLFLYEPGYGAVLSPEPQVLDRVDDLVAAGDADAALEHFYRRAVGMSADDVTAMRRQPSWHARLASVPTISRELRTVAGMEFDPAPYQNIDTPTVLLLGDRSTPGQKAVVAAVHDALPHSTVVLLPGQAHAAQITAPDLVANAFVGHRPAPTPA